MAAIRIDCPACQQPVAMTSRGVLYRHRGRRVRTIPGPDTWNPTTIEGAA